MGIKAQDILVLLKIVAMENRPWKQSDLADALGISRAEVSNSLNRSASVGFLDSERNLQLSALFEFIQYGLKYVFPATPGPICRGIATSHSARPIAEKLIVNKDDIYVWPSSEGDARGQSIEPLYHSVPLAIKNDPKLYELLVLVDACRVGRVREQKIAIDELKKRLKA